MRTLRRKVVVCGFTLIELLCLAAIVAVLLLFLIPTNPGRRPGRDFSAVCMSNQRQIVLGELLYANDNNGAQVWRSLSKRFQTSTPQEPNLAANYFRTFTNYLNSPGAFVCPTDKPRTPAASVDQIANSNLSYFAHLSATEYRLTSFLTGDRHLRLTGTTVAPGVHWVDTNKPIGWSKELHSTIKQPSGVMSFADGHTELVKEDRMSAVVHRQGPARLLLAIP